MSFDYEELRTENRQRYGTDIRRVGDLLLGDRYAERLHFIFELLQNAEDALARRPSGWTGSRSVAFRLNPSRLRVSHFGDPFNQNDVCGICAIGQGTKGLTDIGRFGIGFKSVYAVTERPEVYSGTHAFALENYVLPVRVPSVERDPDETVFVLPFEEDDPEVFHEVLRGLRNVGDKVLLFLREIEEIRWTVEGGPSGSYLRESEDIEEGVRRVTVVGEEEASLSEDTWLVFSRPVDTEDGEHVGFAETAFRTQEVESAAGEKIRRVRHSPLVVYFPTVIDTRLGFLVQGPYRTTPSRDNVPPNAPWNNKLVEETGALLVEALRWLRDHERLDVATLRCLPLDGGKFSRAHEGMFTPLFAATKEALSKEPLLPRLGGGYVKANRALLGRTGELRDLLSPPQLGTLFDDRERRWWVTSEITHDRTPELHRYFRDELEIAEITPQTFVSKLQNRSFLETQSDAWVRDLYHFLSGQPRLRRRFDVLPLVRLEDGSHIPRGISEDPPAYLPGPADTDFPTVRAAVCESDTARDFLRSLGLSEPDPIDDVLRNILPAYDEDEGPDITDPEYEAHIDRILTAYRTDSETRRKRLISALSQKPFVRAVDADGRSAGYARPSSLYIPTERLLELFQGIEGVRFVDPRQACLRGTKVRRLLEATDAVRYLRPVKRTGLDRLTDEERRQLREEAGKPETSGQKDRIRDWELHGLAELLEFLRSLTLDERRTRAKLLWEELAHLEERHGKSVFEGTYSWSHYGNYSKQFLAGFVQRLNETAWVPDDAGDLKQPDSVLFDDLGWREHPFLQSKIRFKSPLLDELAEEAGIDPGVLDLLKEVGVTSEAELRDRLGLKEEREGEAEDEGRTAAPDRTDSEEPSRRGRTDPTGRGDAGAASGTDGERGRDQQFPQVEDTTTKQETVIGAGGGGQQSASDSTDTKRFESYVATHPDDPGAEDPDGLDRHERMQLEEKALDLILSLEPEWHRTKPGNPGFDLYEANEEDEKVRWCEVKAMTGSLDDRPVGMSRTQFEHARRRGESYWLYVVECAGTEHARIVRIRDPAGRARTFTFDRGWRAVADVEGSSDHDEG